MARKVALLAASITMVVALLVVSCGPRTSGPIPAIPTPAAPTPAVPTPGTPTPAVPTPAASAEKPKYGGTLNIIQPSFIDIFAPGLALGSTMSDSEGPGAIVYEQFINLDYTRGLAGTGEVDYGASNPSTIPSMEFVKGWVAESWEIPEQGVWVYNVRKGMHWALDPTSEASRLVGGREVTADDFIASIQLAMEPTSPSMRAQPGLFGNMKVEKTGPWQLTVRTPVDAGAGLAWINGIGAVNFLWAKDWLAKYKYDNDWRNTVGTGPYMLTDYLSGSVATFKRNPNYWQKSPVGPGKGDQLPYPDVAKYFIIPDLSTRLATMRTGKGDILGIARNGVLAEDAKSLISTNPNIKFKTYIGLPFGIAMRTDKQDLAYKDKRVRQALMMATDFESIKNGIYGGEAEIYSFPLDSSVGKRRPSFEELPASVQALYKYNPEKAKQLLAEAGYTTGFKATMLVRSFAAETDLAAAVKAMWAKVGVDVELQVKETAVYNSLLTGHSYDTVLFSMTTMTPLNQRYQFKEYRDRVGDRSFANQPPGRDPVLEKTFQEVSANSMVDWKKADQLIYDMVPYALEQAYYINLPAAFSYRFWQPWIKGFYGEATTEYWISYVWVDQDLKEKMTGRR